MPDYRVHFPDGSVKIIRSKVPLTAEDLREITDRLQVQSPQPTREPEVDPEAFTQFTPGMLAGSAPGTLRPDTRKSAAAAQKRKQIIDLQNQARAHTKRIRDLEATAQSSGGAVGARAQAEAEKLKKDIQNRILPRMAKLSEEIQELRAPDVRLGTRREREEARETAEKASRPAPRIPIPGLPGITRPVRDPEVEAERAALSAEVERSFTEAPPPSDTFFSRLTNPQGGAGRLFSTLIEGIPAFADELLSDPVAAAKTVAIETVKSAGRLVVKAGRPVLGETSPIPGLDIPDDVAHAAFGKDVVEDFFDILVVADAAAAAGLAAKGVSAIRTRIANTAKKAGDNFEAAAVAAGADPVEAAKAGHVAAQTLEQELLRRVPDSEDIGSQINAIATGERKVPPRTAPKTAPGAATPDAAVEAARTRPIPEKVQRIEPAGREPGTPDKPQGLYTSPANVESPHADLGGKVSTFDVNPNARVLRLEPLADESELVMRAGANSAGAGVHAARKLLGDKEFQRLRALRTKRELIEEARKIDPTVEWERYFDNQEIMEGIGGVLARKAGYDAIWLPDADPLVTTGEFDEFVALTDNAFRPAPRTAPKTAPEAPETPPKAPPPTGTPGVFSTRGTQAEQVLKELDSGVEYLADGRVIVKDEAVMREALTIGDDAVRQAVADVISDTHNERVLRPATAAATQRWVSQLDRKISELDAAGKDTSDLRAERTLAARALFDSASRAGRALRFTQSNIDEFGNLVSRAPDPAMTRDFVRRVLADAEAEWATNPKVLNEIRKQGSRLLEALDKTEGRAVQVKTELVEARLDSLRSAARGVSRQAKIENIEKRLGELSDEFRKIRRSMRRNRQRGAVELPSAEELRLLAEMVTLHVKKGALKAAQIIDDLVKRTGLSREEVVESLAHMQWDAKAKAVKVGQLLSKGELQAQVKRARSEERELFKKVKLTARTERALAKRIEETEDIIRRLEKGEDVPTPVSDRTEAAVALRRTLDDLKAYERALREEKKLEAALENAKSLSKEDRRRILGIPRNPRVREKAEELGAVKARIKELRYRLRREFAEEWDEAALGKLREKIEAERKAIEKGEKWTPKSRPARSIARKQAEDELRRLRAYRQKKARLDELEAQLRSGTYVPSTRRTRQLSKEEAALERRRKLLADETIRLRERTGMAPWIETAMKLYNLPRSMLATLDMSPVGLQGWYMLTNPRDWPKVARAFGGAVRGILDSEFAAKVHNSHIQRVEKVLDAAGLPKRTLYIQDWNDTSFNKLEDEFIAPNFWRRLSPVKGSERFFATYMNELRVSLFEEMSKTAAIGEFEAVQLFINALTGRGTARLAGQNLAPLLNLVLFGPRWNWSRPEVILRGFTKSPAVRKALIKRLATSTLTVNTVGILGEQQGWWDYDWDITSKTFGRFVFADGSTIDPWGGNRPWARLISSAAIAMTQNAGLWEDMGIDAEKVGKEAASRFTNEFIDWKLNPGITTTADLIFGHRVAFFGKPVAEEDAAAERLIRLFNEEFEAGRWQPIADMLPIALADMVKVWTEPLEEGDPNQTLLTLSILFGVPYQDPPSVKPTGAKGNIFSGGDLYIGD